jgi:hypothetical protein
MIYEDGNPLMNNYNESKVNMMTISNNLKKSRKFLIFSAIASALLGGIYSAAFYMIYIKGYPSLFTVLNYINFCALFVNALFGLIAVIKSNEKFALYYYVSTLTIFRISILYQIVRLVIIFMGYFTTISNEPYYVTMVKVFAVISLILSCILYYFVSIWAKFFFLILKTYVTLFNRINGLENILKISPSFLGQFSGTRDSEQILRESMGRDSYIPIKNQEK